MDRRSVGVGLGVVVAALAIAFVIVRTAKGPVEFGIRSGDPIPGDEPPLHALGSSNEQFAPPRCVELTTPSPLSAGPSGALDIGEAVIDASGLVAIGVVRADGKERMASVLTFTLGEGSAKVAVTDIGRSVGDDPPPHPFILDGALEVARVETDRDRRRLRIASLGKIDGAGSLGTGSARAPVADLYAFDQTKDESLAFDIAAESGSSASTRVAVWDDDEAGRGVIWAGRLRELPDRAGQQSIISPKTTDAEAPRIVGDGAGGAWVAWIARKAELDAGPTEVAGHFVESPAEVREARWVEVAHLGDQGALRGAVTRLTPSRVSDFDLHRTTGGVDVLMRDEAGDESRGARIVLQHVRETNADILADPMNVIVREGVGGADPIIVDDGASGLLTFVDMAERARCLPLPLLGAVDAGNAGIGTASAELLIDSGRVLASRPLAAVTAAGRLAGKIGRQTDRGAVVIAAGSKLDRAEARILLCER